jgi:hypothetical protein
MEPTDARRMVPCFDEPLMKATWMVTVMHPVGTVALTNGIENQEPVPIRKILFNSFYDYYFLGSFVSIFDKLIHFQF